MNDPLLNCPWSNFTRGSTQFCEAPQCSWVESPGIAWAGFIYIGIGLYIYFSRRNKDSSWLLNSFPFFAIMMGVGSALYHSSHAFIFQAWDVGAMFLLGTALVITNLIELGFVSSKTNTQKIIFWLLIIFELGLFLIFKGISGPIILGSLIGLFILSECWISRNRKYLWMSLGIFTLAGSALWIEHRSGLCDPHNHIFQWHAVWDGLSAVTYLTLHLYLREKAFRKT